MVNLHTLKKRRVNLGKAIIRAKDSRKVSKYTIDQMIGHRERLNDKISALRQKKIKKK